MDIKYFSVLIGCKGPQDFYELELRKVEVIDRAGGECGILEMAGRTEIIRANTFFCVEKIYE